MFLKCLPYGLFGSNCYIAGDHGEGFIIDPGVKAENIIKEVEASGLKIKYIIYTHGHIDHILSGDTVQDKLNAKIVMHESDLEALSNPVHNGAILLGEELRFKAPDVLVKDSDVLEVGELKLEIIHTPGHTPGGICVKVGDVVFTGDTLFRLSIGRTDLGGGNYDTIINSIKNKLLSLEDHTTVYPGHNEPTTVAFERKNNPFLR